MIVPIGGGGERKKRKNPQILPKLSTILRFSQLLPGEPVLNVLTYIPDFSVKIYSSMHYINHSLISMTHSSHSVPAQQIHVSTNQQKCYFQISLYLAPQSSPFYWSIYNLRYNIPSHSGVCRNDSIFLYVTKCSLWWVQLPCETMPSYYNIIECILYAAHDTPRTYWHMFMAESLYLFIPFICFTHSRSFPSLVTCPCICFCVALFCLFLFFVS